MKKLITIFVLSIVSAVTFAQTSSDKKHEIGIGYGVVAVQELATFINDYVILGIAGSEVDKSDGSGVINASYQYHLTNKLSVGGTAFWSRTTVTYKDSNASSKWNIYGLMAGSKYRYISTNKFQLYSNAALGYASYQNKSNQDKNSTGSLAYQVSPIGIRIGQKIAFNCEAGFGCTGLLNAGLSIKI